MRSAALIFSIILSMTVLIACHQMIRAEKVKEDFLKKNPSFVVKEIYVGEGHSDAAEFHIKYTKPDDAFVYEAVWEYLYDDKNGWVLNSIRDQRRINLKLI